MNYRVKLIKLKNSLPTTMQEYKPCFKWTTFISIPLYPPSMSSRTTNVEGPEVGVAGIEKLNGRINRQRASRWKYFSNRWLVEALKKLSYSCHRLCQKLDENILTVSMPAWIFRRATDNVKREYGKDANKYVKSWNTVEMRGVGITLFVAEFQFIF